MIEKIVSGERAMYEKIFLKKKMLYFILRQTLVPTYAAHLFPALLQLYSALFTFV